MEEKIKRLREERYSYKEIGLLLGVSKQYVHQIYKKYHTISNIGTLRKEVLKRDFYNCQMCGKTDFQVKLFVHHINKENGDVIDNLITLCKKCHGLAHRWINKREKKERTYILTIPKIGILNICKKCGKKGHKQKTCNKVIHS